jgi:hypothetical protein
MGTNATSASASSGSVPRAQRRLTDVICIGIAIRHSQIDEGLHSFFVRLLHFIAPKSRRLKL